MTRSFFAALVCAIAIVLGTAPSSAQNAYIPNGGGVSVIDTATNTVVGTIPVGASGGVAVTSDGSKVYVGGDNTVSVIDTATNTVVGTIGVGASPIGVAVTPDGSKVYVTSFNSPVYPFCGPPVTLCLQALISVIDTATNTVVGTIPLGVFTARLPLFTRGAVLGIAVSPDRSKVYVTYAEGDARYGIHVGVSVIDTATSTVDGGTMLGVGLAEVLSSSSGVAVSPDGSKVYAPVFGFFDGYARKVAVIDTATNTVSATIPVGPSPTGVAVSPDGSKVYVVTTNPLDGTSTVSVIDTATNTVVGLPIPVGSGASGIAVTPDGSKVYVVGNTVSVIDTATNTVVAVLPVGGNAFGVFIQPRFAGTIGDANCYGKSLSALARTFGRLNAAAIALGFPTVQGLQTAVNAFCGA
jgi:YVTN family beta-propeller protein